MGWRDKLSSGWQKASEHAKSFRDKTEEWQRNADNRRNRIATIKTQRYKAEMEAAEAKANTLKHEARAASYQSTISKAGGGSRWGRIASNSQGLFGGGGGIFAAPAKGRQTKGSTGSAFFDMMQGITPKASKPHIKRRKAQRWQTIRVRM